jgi:two-component system heavy metal sensor histidine kinase CusS
MNAEQPRLTLRDGRPGRVRVGTWAPRMSEDDPGAVASGRLVHVAVARSTEGIDATLGLLDQLLAFGGVTALGFAGIAAWFAVRRGLRPLARVVGRLDAIDATRLTERMSSQGVPDELRVAVETVNGLLARLEQSFSRARAFNADVSHELRTPLSGLKAILEVTASKDRDGPAYRTALSQALSVVSQLEGLVENLLLLSRVDAGQLEAKREPVSLRSFVDDCWAPHAARAEAKRLTFTNEVADDASMLTDRARLRMIIGNLLGNAVAYTDPAGAIVVDTVGAVVRVKDSGPLVPPADLERIFLPFVRLDPSRTGTEAHSGIGLALVRALCGSLSLEVAARHADGWLAFEVTHRTS